MKTIPAKSPCLSPLQDASDSAKGACQRCLSTTPSALQVSKKGGWRAPRSADDEGRFFLVFDINDIHHI